MANVGVLFHLPISIRLPKRCHPNKHPPPPPRLRTSDVTPVEEHTQRLAASWSQKALLDYGAALSAVCSIRTIVVSLSNY